MEKIDLDADFKKRFGADMDALSDGQLGRIIQEDQLAKVQKVLADPKELASFGKRYREHMRSPEFVRAMMGAIGTMKFPDKQG